MSFKPLGLLGAIQAACNSQTAAEKFSDRAKAFIALLKPFGAAGAMKVYMLWSMQQEMNADSPSPMVSMMPTSNPETMMTTAHLRRGPTTLFSVTAPPMVMKHGMQSMGALGYLLMALSMLGGAVVTHAVFTLISTAISKCTYKNASKLTWCGIVPLHLGAFSNPEHRDMACRMVTPMLISMIVSMPSSMALLIGVVMPNFHSHTEDWLPVKQTFSDILVLGMVMLGVGAIVDGLILPAILRCIDACELCKKTMPTAAVAGTPPPNTPISPVTTTSLLQPTP